MHRIIGTAGHIDHGKTSLVKALTGQDTDRLKEEKERGISIDLGFAHLDLPDGARAGVVDVPGHERFIRNMLAGAHGMDLVLFTVAADDGVMPQTEEHLDILHLLGVSRAIFAITKVDRVPPGRIGEVADEIRVLVAGSGLEGSPIVPVSVVTGRGLQDLRDRIAAMIRDDGALQAGGRFRLPVDRAFVSAGHGMIATGTAIGGAIRSGDVVRRLPGGELLRVRSVQVHNTSVDSAARGQRIALNVTGSGRVGVARGDVLCDQTLTLVSDRFDARLEVRPRALSGIKDHQKVRVHVGTAERLGKAILLGSPERPWPEALAPGETGYSQIVLEDPVHLFRGDRFIVRDETGQRTLGGGCVIHPSASRHKKSDTVLMKALLAFERGEAAAFVHALVRDTGEFAVPLRDIAQLSNHLEEEIRNDLRSSGDVHAFADGGRLLYAPEASCGKIRISIVELLRTSHTEHPLLPGVTLEEARASLGIQVPQTLFRMLVDELVVEGIVARDGNVLALPNHRVAIPEADRALVEQIRTLLGQAPMAPPDVPQLTIALGVSRRKLMELLGAMERHRTIVGIAPDLYLLHDCVDRVRDDLTRWLSARDGITAAEFRDQYKTSRKYAIPLLEYFDREGITLRKGDVRRLRQSKGSDTA